MAEMIGRVVVLELNEITWDLLDPLIAKGRLPNFARMIRDGARAEAWANEEPGQLDPWVTWTTVYTGVPQSVHKLTMLEQDRETIGAKRIWEYLADANLPIGLFGSANSWPPMRTDGFWIPGSFSRDFATFPEELRPIQEANVGLTRDHSASDGNRAGVASLVPKLMRLGLRPATVAMLAGEVARMKARKSTKWRVVALQPQVNLDLFLRLYRQRRPTFATLHSNHVAYYMHRFWRAMDPAPFEIPPSKEERSTYGGCVEHGFVVADRILGRLRKTVGPSVHVAVLSSCGQQPAVGDRYSKDQQSGHVGLRIRIEKLLAMLAIDDKVEFSNLMAPEWKVDFTDPELLASSVDLLRRARNPQRDCNVFDVSVAGRSICLGAVRAQQMEDQLEIATPSGNVMVSAKEMLVRHAEVAKSGYHHPKGVLIISGPKIKQGLTLDPCDNLDIAPTLMRLMDQPIPNVMAGRVLDEALASDRKARIPVTA